VLLPIASAEFAAYADQTPAALSDASEPTIHSLIRRGQALSAVALVTAGQRRDRLRRMFLDLLAETDLLITPTVAVAAFAAGRDGPDRVAGRPVDSHLGWSPFSYPFNLVGFPAVTLPCGRTGDGMPIGLQLVGPPGGDRVLLARAARIARICADDAGDWPFHRPA
jgi:aspartyl-tRNA(Asn)/glutamyl-tRNA(Gln) amidotransferase subunit A